MAEGQAPVNKVLGDGFVPPNLAGSPRVRFDGKYTVMVNQKSVYLPVDPQLVVNKNGDCCRLLVPYRLIAEALGANASYWRDSEGKGHVEIRYYQNRQDPLG